MPDDINAMRAKLARATQAMASVAKTKTANLGTYTYTYATLTDVLNTVKDALTEQGLVLMQPVEIRDGFQVVSTLITDITTGEYLMFPGPGVPVKGDPQAAGSALTYNRRYALTSLFGLEVDDDDGAVAHRSETRPQRRTEAEGEIRDGIAKLTREERTQFAADFQEEFHSTLTNLPESKHGDALGYWKFWSTASPETREDAATAEDE